MQHQWGVSALISEKISTYIFYFHLLKVQHFPRDINILESSHFFFKMQKQILFGKLKLLISLKNTAGFNMNFLYCNDIQTIEIERIWDAFSY